MATNTQHLIDLSQQGRLNDVENRVVRTFLIYAGLSELMRVSNWSTSEYVTHGGTGLLIGMGSPRYSEDIDIYLAENRWHEGVSETIRNVVTGLQERVDDQLPGSELTVKPINNQPGPDGVQRTHAEKMIWSHPRRQGKIHVKFEICRTNPELLSAYPSTTVEPNHARVDFDEPVPVPTLEAAWADKVVAAPNRNYAKTRDLHDLAFLRHTRNISGRDLDAGAAAHVRNVAAIYDVDVAELPERMEAYLQKPETQDIDHFASEMARWYSREQHAQTDFAQLLEAGRAEAERSVDVLRETFERTPTPG